MNKLFDSYTWKFNVTGMGDERSTEHFSKYGNGTATMHDPTIKAILYYATAMRDFGIAAIGTGKDSTIVEVNEDSHTKIAIFFETTKRFLACNYSNNTATGYKLGKNAEDGTELIMALIPTLLEDEEFAEQYRKIAEVCDAQPDIVSVVEAVKNDPDANKAMFITDGSCGVRELIDWVQSYMVLGSMTEAAECTVIPSASADVENQHEIKIACLNPHFVD